MRSAEIARLAGVSVRTLRHYHQIGVLAEPPRTSNGYRDYSIQDLIKVLRIRQLSSLGIPLEQAALILDDTDAETMSSKELRDQLDRQLAEEIERLTHQRQLIAQLSAYDATPDLPPELVPFYSLFTVAGYSRRIAQMDRDQAILWSHFAEETGKAHLVALYQKLTERPELLVASAELSQRFEAIDSSSTDEQISNLVEDFITVFADVAPSLVPDAQAVELGAAAELIENYADETYNAQQLHTLTLLAQRLTTAAEPETS